MGRYAEERVLERVAQAAGRGLDLISFWDQARDAVSAAIPHYLCPCWYTLDPASLLVTSHYDHGMIPQLPVEWLAHEYQEDDYDKLVDVARSERGISTLHEVTSEDPRRSRGWEMFIKPYGGEQQLLLALRTPTKEVWGVLALFREPGQPHFSPGELDLLRSLAPHLAEGARRGLLIGEASDPEGPESPGLLVLDGSWHVQSLTPGVERWLDSARGRLGRPGEAAAVGAGGGRPRAAYGRARASG